MTGEKYQSIFMAYYSQSIDPVLEGNGGVKFNMRLPILCNTNTIHSHRNLIQLRRFQNRLGGAEPESFWVFASSISQQDQQPTEKNQESD
jgi:hypothetical protein